ncbi:MAG: HAD family hydrolase [Bacteroidales bacterium]|nr:HAD family hydrolase [Bacteroidales bacterium]MCF8458890.1 HAD family hydrolase [Bacteroidales bacterium]
MKNTDIQICLEKVEHVIWDYNGTLLNDLDLCVTVINKVLARRGLEQLSREGYQAVFDFPVRDYYEKIGFNFQKESFEIVGTEFIEEYNREQAVCELQEGALSVIRKFNELGIDQSILSARLQKSLDEEIEGFGIQSYFSYIFGLDHHYADGKLKRGRQLIEKINKPSDKIVLIGDTLHDLHVAQKLGIGALLVAHGHHSYDRLIAETKMVFHSLPELMEVMVEAECG